MNIKKILLYSVIGMVISGVFFGTILYFTVFRTPREVTNQKNYYEYEMGSFSTNLSNQRNFFKGELVIETSNEKLLKIFDKKNAELRDRIIETIISKEPEELLTPEGQQTLRKELIEKISQVMTSDEITNIYFVDYIIQ